MGGQNSGSLTSVLSSAASGEKIIIGTNFWLFWLFREVV